jgi:hypothetical protein
VTVGPNILVVSPDELATQLLVEVDVDSPVQDREASLKHQMIRMGAPTGLLVTPDWVTVFRDTFKSYSVDTIEAAERFPTNDIPELQRVADRKNGDREALEDAVQHWLTQLQYRVQSGQLATGLGDFKDALRAHILPVLQGGEIRAAGPRWPRRAAR